MPPSLPQLAVDPYFFISFRQNQEVSMSWFSAPPPVSRPCSQWASPLSQGQILLWLLLTCIWFCFCLGHACLQLAVKPHRGNEPKECPGPAGGFHAVISSPASRPGFGSPAGVIIWQMPVCEAGTPFNHRRMAANQVLWHRRKSVSLAHSIVWICV